MKGACLIAVFLSVVMSGCATVEDIQSSNAAKTMGSFQLNPVRLNDYWYNGTSYEYNQYEIKIVSEPVNAKIRWNGKYIGTTPFVYKFSGTLDKGERITVHAIPMDENTPAQEASLKVREELPREVRFDFNRK
jgi:hypothetical protein